jgi:NhaA family Na+:H+ antiporter
MSLFVAGLAFTDPAMLDVAKLGVLGASVMAGLVGYTLLRRARVAPDAAPAAPAAARPAAATGA